jgi:hypothetical protein
MYWVWIFGNDLSKINVIIVPLLLGVPSHIATKDNTSKICILKTCDWMEYTRKTGITHPSIFDFYFPPFSFTCHQSFTVANLTICFFLLKNLRYFKAYNTNKVCSMKNHICENLMYLNIFCRRKRMVKIATVKVWWQVNENGGTEVVCL